MTPSRRHTLAAVLRGYLADKVDEELRGEWGSAVFFRPPALLLTAPLLNLGVPPMAVTLLALLLILALPWLAVYGGEAGYLYLGCGAALIGILDCLDGNMARTAARTSRLGRYLDFLADVLHRILGYLTVGLLVQLQAGGGWLRHAALLALAAAAAAIVARLCRFYTASWFAAPPPSGAAAPSGAFDRLVQAVFPFVSGLDPIWPLLVLLAGAAGHLPWLLAWLILLSALDFLHTQLAILRRLA